MAGKATPAFLLGENVSAVFHEDGRLTLEIDTKRALRRSRQRVGTDGRVSGGENIIIATTSGNTPIPGLEGHKLGLNYFRPPMAGE